MLKRIFVLAALLGLLAIPAQSRALDFHCTFPNEPNNVVRNESGSIVLVSLNWEEDKLPAVEEAIEKVIPLLEGSPFLSWPPARGGGAIPVYPATSQLVTCWEREYPGKKVYGTFRAISGPYGPGIYLREGLPPFLLKVTLVHEAVHAFWTRDELLPRIVSISVIWESP